jgi:glycosyltransferase involved in cell wall biosynthesis
MISCLVITRPDRLGYLVRALRCFVRQTHPERELVILHDGDISYHRRVSVLAARMSAGSATVHRAPEGLSLGALRSLSIELAAGDHVCQWDDDDLHHPRRLELQFHHMRRAGADYCCLTDQLHWFETTGEFVWDDWTVEPAPYHLIPGTLLGRRDGIGRYPEIARGEDTAVILDLIRRGERIAPMSGAGWCHIYTYHGTNTFGFNHHIAIARLKRLRGDQLAARRAVLEKELPAYGLPLAEARFPDVPGPLVIPLTGAAPGSETQSGRNGRAATL